MSDTMVVRTPAAVRARVGPGQSVGLVPTMGALHEGHLTLIRRAAAENDVVVVSVFVNPTQFNDPEDLARYPRVLETDAEMARAAGATIVYAPEVETMYPEGFATSVHVGGMTGLWEGESRPGHFDGVALVVTMLLNQVRPHRSYFGEKDYQQLAMVRRMHRDLWLPGEIVGVPTVREPDGLAMSSRNALLTAEGRGNATALHEALAAMREAAVSGERGALKLAILGAVIVKRKPEIDLDYLQIVDPESLDPIEVVTPRARAIVAAIVDEVRLIDNMELLPVGGPT